MDLSGNIILYVFEIQNILRTKDRINDRLHCDVTGLYIYEFPHDYKSWPNHV